jgi:NAD(P)-dependent dehydrogenase (short-subunit alcohol dehydrogenase family)
MAGAALDLASRAGAYVTGTVLAVDGGISTTA